MITPRYLIIESILFFTIYFSTCHGTPYYWNTTHERCQTFEDSSLEQIACPATMMVVETSNLPDKLEHKFICDCPPYTIYFPDTDSCHEVYKRGPCPDQHYVHIRFDETEPSCVKNPCKEEDQVFFEGSCHKLGDTQPCPVMQYLNVNLNNFQLECRHFQGKKFNAVNDFNYWCARGSLRVKCGICKRVVG